MTTKSAPSRAPFRLVSAAGMGVLALSLGLSGCAPPGQRLFNPNAGRPPKPYIPPALPAKPAPAPFVQVVSGTPEADWRPAIIQVAKRALARKPNVLFIVSVLSPRVDSPAGQVEALTHLTQTDGRAIGDALIAAGAVPEQVQIEARTEQGIASPRTRIDVR
ncbi:hypothetical protein [Kozakia baliensis]|uniref:hypothetical protein n=1 Tax=Kozakia baliensis TaxID=153496 RepID=UPI00087C67AE|nr:hypothetical protein [Kozakia baliensis]AOX20997.1 hypothetical protein A0U90_12700 [Kozakia baliensis]